MVKYYVESFKKEGERKFVIRERDDNQIEKYDFNKHKWVEDDYMLKIYTGGIDVDCCSEEYALEEIKRIEQRIKES